jgi:hypothetical protein
MSRIFTAILFLCAALKSTSAEKILFAENFSRGLSNGWQNLAYFKKPTDYQFCRGGTNFYVRAVADNSCSALSTALELAPPRKLKLRWRWRVDSVNTNGSERDLRKFDHAARLFVAFEAPMGLTYTLNYFWGNVEPPGTVLQHPKSSRGQIFVLESGNSKAGQWVSEERDVTADWEKVFPDRPMPKIIGLGVMTDSDSLGEKLTGCYAEIVLTGE